jgi:hypothetical protein
VEVLRHPSVPEAWDSYRDEDRREVEWREEHRLPGFSGDRLFEGLDSNYVTPLNGAAYRDMMHEKIRVTCQQAVHAVRMRLRSRLKGLDEALAMLAATRGTTGLPAGPTGRVLEAVLQALNGG